MLPLHNYSLTEVDDQYQYHLLIDFYCRFLPAKLTRRFFCLSSRQIDGRIIYLIAWVSDGQTNWIKILFVCLSQVRVAGRVSCADGLSDGQTNWIKIIPFVCLSQVHPPNRREAGGFLILITCVTMAMAMCRPPPPALHLHLHPPTAAKSTTITATRHLVYSSLHRSRFILGSSVTHFAITALKFLEIMPSLPQSCDCDLQHQHYLVLTSKLLATEGGEMRRRQ